MYIEKSTLLNSGPNEKLELNFQFNDDSSPKPIILLGRNGSGKTNFLSSLADAIIELQSSKFNDIMPINHSGERTYYRMLGYSTTQIGKSTQATAVKFKHGQANFICLSHSGPFSHDFDISLAEYAPLNHWSEKDNDKQIHIGDDTLEACFETGSYTFFPANRYEEPWWLAGKDQKSEIFRFSQKVSKKLDKPLVVNKAFDNLKPWIADVILDQAVDAVQLMKGLHDASGAVLKGVELEHKLIELLTEAAGAYSTLLFVNHIFSQVLGTEVHLVRAGRKSNDRKIQIRFLNQSLILPSLDSLSTGQQNLLSIFLTILRYGDTGSTSVKPQDIVGICIIDEVDAHLHADMQFDVLPRLVSLFPKIQFIISSHAPLFVLGMNRKFANRCALIDIPSGLTIDAERFSEFERSMQIIKETQLFEKHMQDAFARTVKPLVLCEGETDPLYFEAACELLGFHQLKNSVEFSSVGSKSAAGSFNNGIGALDNARKMLSSNPGLTIRQVACIYDCDDKDKTNVLPKLLTLTLSKNDLNEVTVSGIENMLPSAAIESRFITEKITRDRNKKISETVISKVDLCQYICKEKRDRNDFSLFDPVLKRLCEFFSLPAT